jgi:uncharacterized protein YjbI with pentapeptide repeats
VDSLHVEKLKEGVLAWNRWRVENPKLLPDLSHLNFSTLFPPNTSRKQSRRTKNSGSLSGINLRGANLEGADLSGQVIVDADLANANLRNANLSQANAAGVNLQGADLTCARLNDIQLQNAGAKNANFAGAQLNSANLSRSQLTNADLSLSDLSGAKISGVVFGKHNARSRSTGTVGAEFQRTIDELLQSPERQFWSYALSDSEADDGEAGLDADNREPASRRRDGKKWNDLHLAKLKEGVDAWNAWRKLEPNVVPNLEGLDFSSALEGTDLWKFPEWDEGGKKRIILEGIDFGRAILTKSNLSGVVLDFANLSNAKLNLSDLQSASLYGAVLSHADLTSAKAVRCSLWEARGAGTQFFDCDLSDAGLRWSKFDDCDFSSCLMRGAIADFASFQRSDFSRANLSDADFEGSKLGGSKFLLANMTSASLIGSDVQQAEFSFCRLTAANVGKITFNRSALKGKCIGVGGVNEIYGDLKFQRAIKDQAFVDTLMADLKDAFVSTTLPDWLNELFDGNLVLRSARRYFLLPAARFAVALFGGFATISPFVGGAVGLLMWTIISQGLSAQHFAVFTHIGNISIPREQIIFVLSFAAAFGVLGGWLGKYIRFLIWGLFDYGRDWDRVVVFSVLVVAVNGWLYQWGMSEHVIISGSELNKEFFLYPWFVAAMGFATLGISDMVRPVTGLGMLMILGNVMSGWLTLGLLISVMGDAFKERGA